MKIQTAAVREPTDIIHLTPGVWHTSTGNLTLQGPSSLHCWRTMNYRVHIQNALCIGGPAGTKYCSKSPTGWGAGVWWGPGRQRWTGTLQLLNSWTNQLTVSWLVSPLQVSLLVLSPSLTSKYWFTHGDTNTAPDRNKEKGKHGSTTDRLIPESNSRTQIGLQSRSCVR